jgi:amino acid transporter
MASTGIDMPTSARRQYDLTEDEKDKPKYDDEVRIGNYEDSSVKLSYDSTHRQLRPRHIQLIGIGGTIGTALYVQIGHGLINGGPASLFLAFTIWYVGILGRTVFKREQSAFQHSSGKIGELTLMDFR